MIGIFLKSTKMNDKNNQLINYTFRNENDSTCHIMSLNIGDNKVRIRT